MSRLARLAQMTNRERILLARVSVMLPLVDASLRVAGFQRTFDWITRITPRSSLDRAPNAARLTHSAIPVGLAGNHFPRYRPTCLPQSLVLWHLLRSNGTPAELNIGVRKAENEFSAHAWIEVDGQVINDSPDVAEHYVRVDLKEAQLIDGT